MSPNERIFIQRIHCQTQTVNVLMKLHAGVIVISFFFFITDAVAK
jgi:hypothetical protein